MNHNDMTTSPRRLRRRFLQAGAVLGAVAMLSGCVGSLRGDSSGAQGGAGGDGSPVTTTSPLFPDVEVRIDSVQRRPDNSALVEIEVENGSGDDIDQRDLFGDYISKTSLLDATAGRRHSVIGGDPGCLCSRDVTVPAGGTARLHLMYADLDPDTSAVRISLPRWAPVGGVPVVEVDEPKVETSQTLVSETTPGVEVEVLGLWRVEDGLMARIENRNDTADRLLSPTSLDDAMLTDPATLRAALVQQAGLDRVMTGSEGGLAAGATVTRDVLFSGVLPGDADRAILRIPGMRTSDPIEIQDSGAPEPTYAVGGSLDDPSGGALEGLSVASRGEPVPIAPFEEPSVRETGSEYDLPDPVTEMTSPAEPGFTLAPRAVVRVGAQKSVLFMDLRNSGADSSWPEALKGPISNDPVSVALIDPAAKQRLGPLVASFETYGASSRYDVNKDRSRLLHIGYPAVAGGSDTVTVDIPGFGRAPDVPVIDAPAPKAGEVAATMRVDSNAGARMDVFEVSSLPGDNGTLVRARWVNESDPDSYRTGFRGEDGSVPGSICGLVLNDAATGRQFDALSPCVASSFTTELGAGDSMVAEARFPTLPADVKTVTVDSEGWTSTPPIEVGESSDVWFLDLPRAADSPQGRTFVGSVGVADDLQTEVRDGDEVDLQLNTDVLFAFGSAELSPTAAGRVSEVGKRLADQASGTVTIAGHTDSVGEDAANLRLSQQRAEAVADVLRTVAPGLTFEVEGLGETEPVAANEIEGRDNPDGRERNRRVTVTYTAG